MNEAEARERLREVGEPFQLSWHDDRWLALGDSLVGFAVDDNAGCRRLELEAWLLDRWRAGGVPVPRVVRQDAARGVQLRERMHGLSGPEIHSETSPSPLYPGELPDFRARLHDAPLSGFGARLAASYGELAARIRRAVPVEDARSAGLGPTSRRSIDIDEAIARLAASSASAEAKAAATRARDWLVAIPPPDAVIHGDLHFFNMCAAPDGTITGVFDLGDSGIDCAAQDLSHVLGLGSRFAAIAMSAYGPVDAEHVRRAHLRMALDHVLCHGPGTPRHASIIHWTSAAFEMLAVV